MTAYLSTLILETGVAALIVFYLIIPFERTELHLVIPGAVIGSAAGPLAVSNALIKLLELGETY